VTLNVDYSDIEPSFRGEEDVTTEPMSEPISNLPNYSPVREVRNMNA
jgi:hypothetical protein